MKRWRATCIGVLTVLVLMTVSAAAGEKEFAARKWRIGFSANNAKHPFMVAFIAEIKAEAAKYPNVELIVLDGNYDAVKQNNDIEDMVSKRADVLIIRPHQGPTAKPAVAAAKRAGIPLIIVERAIPAPVEDYLAYVKADGVEEGRMLAEAVAKQLRGEALVAEVRGTEGTPDAVERGDGFRQAMKKYPGMKLVSSQTASYQRYLALEVTETILQGHPKLDAVFAHNDEMALGALRALKAAGRAGRTLLLGIDGQKDAFDAIRSGEMFATIVHPLQAKEAFDTAIRHLKGEKIEKKLTIPSTLVTKENVDRVKPNY